MVGLCDEFFSGGPRTTPADATEHHQRSMIDAGMLGKWGR